MEADRGEVVTLDCEDDEEYNYRPTSVSQQETSRSRNRNEKLAGSFGLKGFTLNDQRPTTLTWQITMGPNKLAIKTKL